MPARDRHPKLGILHPSWIVVFLMLLVAWILVWAIPTWEWIPLHDAGRVCGYLAFLLMLVPYVHIGRRRFLHRYLGASDRWLKWHVATAFLAFLFLLIHTGARASGG